MMPRNAEYINPGHFIFGVLSGTLVSILINLASKAPEEVSAMLNQEDAQGDGSSLAVYNGGSSSPQNGTGIPVEMVGHTTTELASSLYVMEESLKEGRKAKVQLMTAQLASQEDINVFYTRMLDAGFHTSRPVAKMAEGIPTVIFTLQKGSPIWTALIALIPTAIIGGLIAFGITRVETLSRALLPLMLVTIGGIVVIVAMITRKPVLKTAQSYLERRSGLKSLPSTIPVELKKA